MIIYVVAIGLCAAILSAFLKKHSPEVAVAIPIAAGIAIILMLLGDIGKIVEMIRELSSESGVDGELLGIILKIIGVALLTEFGAGIVKDAGEESIAKKIELGGKIVMLTMTLPILTALINIIKDLVRL